MLANIDQGNQAIMQWVKDLMQSNLDSLNN